MAGIGKPQNCHKKIFPVSFSSRDSRYSAALNKTWGELPRLCISKMLQDVHSAIGEDIYIYIFWYCRNSWNMNLFSSSSIYNFNILPKGTSAVGCCKWWTKTELAGFSINKCSFFELKTYFQQNLLSFGTEVTCVLVLGPGEIINYMM